MNRVIRLIILVLILQPAFDAIAQERGRIKRRPPTPVEAERIVSDMVMNDGTLHIGDIVSTDRGFFQYRGLAADGVSNDFVPVLNPLSPSKK